MNYTIINDREELQNFVDFLPDLKDNEVFYLKLLCRRKYAPHVTIPSDFTVRRCLTTKTHFIDNIEEMEVPLDAYKFRGNPIPQEALALYCHINPRDYKKAMKKLGKGCWDLLNIQERYSPEDKLYNVIVESKSYNYVTGIDVDSVDVDLSYLKKVESVECKVIETMNGYHILTMGETKDEAYDIHKHFKADKIGDFISPVPGTTQGLFIPRFVKYL